MFIENTTPYIGKLKYRLEKHPHYTGGNPWSILNKIHSDFGFVKLVSRIYPNHKKDGFEINKGKIQKIESFTGGCIGTYEWWEVVSKKSGKQKTLTKSPNPDIYEIRFHGELSNSFMSKDGSYFGDIETGWWYYKNQFRVSEKYPKGVAIQYTKDGYENQYLYHLGGHKLPENQIVGYHGYSHRGGQTFKLGDRIFDETYEPNEEDYEPWEWAGWIQEYDKALIDAYKRKDTFDIKDIQIDGVSRYIPFAKRGKQIIKTWEDAELAAYNLSNYLG
jgi:hypothetical protein